MIFKSELSADGARYTLSVSPWMGFIDRTRQAPDTRVRSVPICGTDGTLATRKYIILPYFVECILPLGRSQQIPMLVFQTTDWMPPASIAPRVSCEMETEDFRKQIRHLPYIANLLMADRKEAPPHSLWICTMTDPYHILKDIVLASMPMGVAPDIAYKACDTIVQRRYEEIATPLW